jgi:chromosome segregation ATPase
MATVAARVTSVEARVEKLETWAGPGQVEALATGQRAIRADIAKLQADVSKLQADVSKIKKTQDRHTGLLDEILRRLPPK